eukprot:925733-Pelagomonas_calceolata.AAC.1
MDSRAHKTVSDDGPHDPGHASLPQHELRLQPSRPSRAAALPLPLQRHAGSRAVHASAGLLGFHNTRDIHHTSLMAASQQEACPCTVGAGVQRQGLSAQHVRLIQRAVGAGAQIAPAHYSTWTHRELETRAKQSGV